MWFLGIKSTHQKWFVFKMQNHLIKTESCRNSFFPPTAATRIHWTLEQWSLGKDSADWGVLESAVSRAPSLLKLWCLQCAYCGRRNEFWFQSLIHLIVASGFHAEQCNSRAQEGKEATLLPWISHSTFAELIFLVCEIPQLFLSLLVTSKALANDVSTPQLWIDCFPAWYGYLFPLWVTKLKTVG